MTPDQLHSLFVLASTGGARLVDTAAWRRFPDLAAGDEWHSTRRRAVTDDPCD